MNNCDKDNYKETETLQLIGSQMNFSLRSNQISVNESPRKIRPHSAAYVGHVGSKVKCTRPKSAEGNVRTKAQQLNWSNFLSDRRVNVSEESTLLTSLYTNSSSKLLQSLIENERHSAVKVTESNSKGSENKTTEVPNVSEKNSPRQSVVPTQPNTTTESKGNESNHNVNFSLSNYTKETQNDNSVEVNKDQNEELHQQSREGDTMMAEKTVRFLEKDRSFQDLEGRIHHHCRNHSTHVCCKHKEHHPIYRSLHFCKNHTQPNIQPESEETESETDMLPVISPRIFSEVKNHSPYRNIHFCKSHREDNTQSVMAEETESETEVTPVKNHKDRESVKDDDRHLDHRHIYRNPYVCKVHGEENVKLTVTEKTESDTDKVPVKSPRLTTEIRNVKTPEQRSTYTPLHNLHASKSSTEEHTQTAVLEVTKSESDILAKSPEYSEVKNDDRPREHQFTYKSLHSHKSQTKENIEPSKVEETESEPDILPVKSPRHPKKLKNDSTSRTVDSLRRDNTETTDGESDETTIRKKFSEIELANSIKNSRTLFKTHLRGKKTVLTPELPNVESSSTPNDHTQESDSSVEESSSEPKQVTKKLERYDRKYENSFAEKPNSSTYEEIVELLQTLEEEDSDNLSKDVKQDSRVDSPLTLKPTDGKIDRLDEVYLYLEEVEKDAEILGLNTTTQNTEKGLSSRKTFSSPRLEELLNKNSVELAHEVLSLKIQIEDQKKGIKLLRETLAEMKQANQTADLAHQEALHKANAEAEAMVQRHQKFIKQLLNEKKKLNETVSKLVEDLKSGEERYKRNVKAVEEKHLIEIKRVKEAQAVAEKLKREKWMEAKTQKIKEMTVKGLEPELSRMAAAQQQEMLELRNLHKAELEAVELRAARRTSELMDQLRAELTKDKENAIERENGNLRHKLEKQFEEERNKLEKYSQKLKDEIRRGEERINNLEIEFQQRILDCKKEAEKERQKMIQDFQDKLEENRRRHSTELKSLRESLEAEKEVWVNSYKKQQTTKFLEREAELHQQYKRERDKDIEVIIEALEKESAQCQKELKEAADNKLKRLKEKLENDLKEVEASEALLKTKLSEAKSLVLEKEDVITELNSQIRQLQTEMSFLKKTCEEMSSERTNLKEIIKKEFQANLQEEAKERENLEREILVLKESHLKELAIKDQVNNHNKNEMQKELTRIYSRIKAAVSKKDKIIESLRDENRAILNRCQHLELMLDRQRRNLLLQ